MSDIYLSLTETPTVVTLSQPVVSGVLSSNVTVTNVVSVNVVTMPAITVQAAAPAVTTVAGSVAVSNFPASQVVSVSNFPASSSVTIANFPSVTTVAGTVALDSASLIALENVTVTVGAAVTVAGFSTSSLPPSTVTVANTVAINGTVTANIFGKNANFSGGITEFQLPVIGFDETIETADLGIVVPVQISNDLGTIRSANPLPISGTVTVGNSVTIGSLPAISGTVTARLQDASGNNLTSTSIGGVQRLNVSLASAATPGGSLPTFVNVYGGSDGSAVRTISVDSSGRQNTNPQFPRVTLIDGSGTVATANTAITVFASSSTRSYLLVQVTTGSAFVNVGATATTVNGINLTAGQGYSWETTIPQGIVSLISTTTSSRYVAKEA